MSHTHPCAVTGCRERTECRGYIVAHDTATAVGAHCVYEHDGDVFLCHAHAAWEPCAHCGELFDVDACQTNPMACCEDHADALELPTEDGQEDVA